MKRGESKGHPKIGLATIVIKDNCVLIGFDGRKNKYAFPGGNWDGNDNGESFEQGAARELFEETGGNSGVIGHGVVCTDFKQLYEYTFFRADTNEWFTSIGFTAEYASGFPGDDLSEARTGWQFMDPKEILKLDLFEPARKGLGIYLNTYHK